MGPGQSLFNDEYVAEEIGTAIESYNSLSPNKKIEFLNVVRTRKQNQNNLEGDCGNCDFLEVDQVKSRDLCQICNFLYKLPARYISGEIIDREITSIQGT